jgi:hypothetical protein
VQGLRGHAEADERLDAERVGLLEPARQVAPLARALRDVPGHEDARVLDPEVLEERVAEHRDVLIADPDEHRRLRPLGRGAESAAGDDDERQETDE